jgi:hypothetical protein
LDEWCTECEAQNQRAVREPVVPVVGELHEQVQAKPGGHRVHGDRGQAVRERQGRQWCGQRQAQHVDAATHQRVAEGGGHAAQVRRPAPDEATQQRLANHGEQQHQRDDAQGAGQLR